MRQEEPGGVAEPDGDVDTLVNMIELGGGRMQTSMSASMMVHRRGRAGAARELGGQQVGVARKGPRIQGFGTTPVAYGIRGNVGATTSPLGLGVSE